MAASRLYGHCEAVWRAMYDQAIPVGQLTGADAYLAGMVPVGALGVYLGALTKLMEGLGYRSTSSYHQVKGVLVRMGCIAQLRRGTAYRIGAWALLARPTEELWAARIGRLGRPAREQRERAQHGMDLAAFLERPPTSQELTALVRAAGARDESALLRLLAALPIQRQRELGVPCLGDAVLGAEHTCRWEPAQASHATAALA